VHQTECIFCEILAGRAEASFIYRDDQCAAFMDIQPVNEGHVLVVPARHEANLSEVSPSEWARVAEVGRRVAAALRVSAVPCEAVNLFLADGEAAGQEVFHSHLHVFPRFKADGFGLRLPEGYHNLPPRSELEARANDLRAAMASLARGAL